MSSNLHYKPYLLPLTLTLTRAPALSDLTGTRVFLLLIVELMNWPLVPHWDRIQSLNMNPKKILVKSEERWVTFCKTDVCVSFTSMRACVRVHVCICDGACKCVRVYLRKLSYSQPLRTLREGGDIVHLILLPLYKNYCTLHMKKKRNPGSFRWLSTSC